MIISQRHVKESAVLRVIPHFEDHKEWPKQLNCFCLTKQRKKVSCGGLFACQKKKGNYSCFYARSGNAFLISAGCSGVWNHWGIGERHNDLSMTHEWFWTDKVERRERNFSSKKIISDYIAMWNFRHPWARITRFIFLAIKSSSYFRWGIENNK